jgi:hypothetical protein
LETNKWLLLQGAADSNSHKAPILPWLRSIDGLNTHDAAYELAIAGGVTTAQVLPGSANNIGQAFVNFLSSLTSNSCYHFLGGQSFVIKLRPTAERSSTSMVIEPPQTLINSVNDTGYIRWRHMKYVSSITHSVCNTHNNIFSFSDMPAVREHLSLS